MLKTRRRSAKILSPLRKFPAKARLVLKRKIKEGARYASSHPFQAASAIGVIALLGFFVNDILTDDVFIDDVVIAGGIAGSANYNGSILTQRAIAEMKPLASARSRAAYASKMMQIVEVQSDEFATERVCNRRFALGTFDEFFLLGTQRGIMSSQTFDQVMTGKSPGLRKAAFAVRQRLGQRWPARQLQLFLAAKGDKFEARIEPSPPVIPALVQTIDNLDRESVSRAFSRLLLDALSPELTAAEFQVRGAGDFSVPAAIAADFLQDRQKELLISSIAMSTQLELSRSYADRPFNYLKFRSENQALLREIDFSRYGDVGTVMKAGITERLMIPQSTRAETYKKYIAPIEPELEKSFLGSVLLSMYRIQLGDTENLDATLKELLKKNRSLAGERINETELTVFLSILLIAEKRWAEADSLLSTIDVDKLDGTDKDLNNQITLVRTLKAIKGVHSGEAAEYEKLAESGFSGHACAELLAISFFKELVKSKAGDDPVRRHLLELMLAGLQRVSNAGIAGFSFYNEWGMIANYAGEYELAKTRFAAALKYEGDHTWALLNWGLSAYQAGDLAEAKTKYQESLSLGVVPNAVHGFLATLYMQDDFIAFLDAFYKYEIAFDAFDLEVRSSFELYAMMSACRQGKSLTATAMRADESLQIQGKTYSREAFDHQNCWLPAQ